MNSRALAADIIRDCLDGDGQSHLLLRDCFRRQPGLNARERSFLTALVHGTLSECVYLDACLDGFSRTPVRKMKPYVRAVLRMGLFQLYFMDRVPASAVCNESVKLIRSRMGDGLTGFVNAVLRKAASSPRPEVEERIRCALPEELFDYLAALYGREKAFSIGRAFLAAPVLWGRIRQSRITADEAVKSLKEDGFSAEEDPLVPGCVRLLRRKDEDTEGLRLEETRAFREGWLQLQDRSAQLAVLAADPRPGMKVLDLCAAPGGKSMQAADMMRDQGRILACDISPARTALIEEAIRRSGFSCVRTQVADAAVFDPEKEGRFDLVIADLPCSGLGTASRKPEIKQRFTGKKLTELAALQRRLLDQAVRYTAPGGRLLFSTCTLTREENTDNADYLAAHPLLRPAELALPDELLADGKKDRLQLFPEEGGGDGFFISLFQKGEET